MAATLEWLGCATFRLRIGSMVVFLDAYIDRVPSAAPIGITTDEVTEADWIVVGHSHFDHLWGAERIAVRTGATIIASYESVRIMEACGIPRAQLIPVAGGERVELGDGVTVSVYPSQHSCVWSHREMPGAGEVCIGDLGVTWQQQNARLRGLFDFLGSLSEEASEHLEASAQGAKGDGGALVFLFETPEGSLLFQDTSGHWSGVLRDVRPDVAILAAAGRGNIDGEPVQGSLADFVARQVDLCRPDTVILSHHDDWLPGFTAPVDVAPIAEAIARRRPQARLVELDYLDPFPLFDRAR